MIWRAFYYFCPDGGEKDLVAGAFDQLYTQLLSFSFLSWPLRVGWLT